MTTERDKWLDGQLKFIRSLVNVESVRLMFWQGHQAFVLVAYGDPPDIDEAGYPDADYNVRDTEDDAIDDDQYFRTGPSTMIIELPPELRA